MRARGKVWKIREKYKHKSYYNIAKLYEANKIAYNFYEYQIIMVNKHRFKYNWKDKEFSLYYYNTPHYSSVFKPPIYWIERYKSIKKALKIARDHYVSEMRLLAAILQNNYYKGNW